MKAATLVHKIRTANAIGKEVEIKFKGLGLTFLAKLEPTNDPELYDIFLISTLQAVETNTIQYEAYSERDGSLITKAITYEVKENNEKR